MVQVLLVDDETSVVDALSIRIPWEELGVSAVHRAYSGLEAFEIFKLGQIDIVITDIRMPGMSGLELIKKITAVKFRTKCILLTGYAEFDYAQEAMRSQVFDYLLKPVSNDELISTVKRLIAQLKAEWDDISSYQRASNTLREHLPLLRNNLLQDLLQGRKMESLAFAEKLEMLKLPFTAESRICMLLIRMEGHFLNYNKQSMSLFEYAVFNITEEIMSADYDMWYGKDSHEYLVVLLKGKSMNPTEQSMSDNELLELRAEELQHNVELYLTGNITILLSNWTGLSENLSDVYEIMLYEMRKMIKGNSGIFKTVDISSQKVRIQSLQCLYEPPMLNQLLEAGRWEEAAIKVDQIMNELANKWNDSLEHINEVYYSLLSSFNYIAHKSGKQLIHIVGLKQLELEAYQRRSLEHFRNWAKDVLGLIREDLDQDNRNTNTIIINRVQQFVEHRLAEDVSLQAIADEVYLNPGYLSKLYKLETGENISDYIYRLRMDKSAYYLTNTHYKIQEICELIGYQNTSYYIKMFKKHFNVTPQEYRIQSVTI
ncbi:response regulator [Paenibacillus psychroresistens]|uniref:Response regulator n=1 Tax=Paenibacillus psychroresistens TaxID=1778678 RepID=A0A6B8RIJ4_9BACL|nr:response regulator [Paenibacillus psychroresistens]QGQ95168.1 response regulator [Paenibacillus psychroresistens]